MPEFSRNIGEAGGGVPSLTPRSATSSSSDVANQVAANFAASLTQGALKGFARKKGREVGGENVTNVDLEQSLSTFDEDLFESQVAQGGLDFEEELTPGQIADLRKDAITEIGKNAKTLNALVKSNRISSIEAQAQMNKLIRAKASNPLVAMFEAELTNAAYQFTGGTPTAGQSAFGLSPDEQRAATVSKARTEALAKREEALATFQMDTGQTREMGEAYYQKVASSEAYLKVNNLNDQEAAYKYRDTYNALTTQGNARFFGQMNDMISEEGFLDSVGVSRMNSLLQQYAAEFNDNIINSNVDEASRKEMSSKLKIQIETLQASINARDLSKVSTAEVTATKNKLALTSLELYPLINLVKETSGEAQAQVYSNMDMKTRIAAIGRWGNSEVIPRGRELQETSRQAMTTLFGVTNPGKVEEDAIDSYGDAALTLDQRGVADTVIESIDNNGDAVLTNLKKVFTSAPSTSLEGLRSTQWIAKANQGDVKAQAVVDTAVGSAYNRLLGSALTFDSDTTSIQVKPVRKPVPAPQFRKESPQQERQRKLLSVATISLPDGMEGMEHVATNLYLTFKKHPWMWKEAYTDVDEAFNGFMVNGGTFEKALEEPVTTPDVTPTIDLGEALPKLIELGVTSEDIDAKAEELGLDKRTAKELKELMKVAGNG